MNRKLFLFALSLTSGFSYAVKSVEQINYEDKHNHSATSSCKLKSDVSSICTSKAEAQCEVQGANAVKQQTAHWYSCKLNIEKKKCAVTLQVSTGLGIDIYRINKGHCNDTDVRNSQITCESVPYCKWEQQ